MKTVLLHNQPLSGNGNHRTGAKRFGRGRITGLALIALVTLGLGYLHFAGGSKSVSVPAGAHTLSLRPNGSLRSIASPHRRHHRPDSNPARPRKNLQTVI